jgi:small-conductance mechanosensitive channel
MLAVALTITARAQTPAPASTNAPAATPPAETIAAADIISKAESTLGHLGTLATAPAGDAAEASIRQQLPEFTTRVNDYTNESGRILAGNPSLDEVRSLEKGWTYLRTTPTAWNGTVADLSKQLAANLAKLDSGRQLWAQTKAAQTAATPPELSQRVQAVLDKFDATRQTLTGRQAALLKLEDQITTLDSRIAGMLGEIAEARDRAVNQLFVANSPPIWSAPLAAAPAPAGVDSSFVAQWATLRSYAAVNGIRFAAHALIFIFLLGLFFWIRARAQQWMAEDATVRAAAHIFATPIATALLLALLCGFWLYPLSPRLLQVILGLLALIPTVVILRQLLEPRLFPILNALIVFYFVEEYRSVSPLGAGWARLLFLAEVLAGILFLLWLLFSKRLSAGAPTETKRFGRATRLAARTALVVLVLGWLADVLGFVLLGNLLCEAVQRSATLALILYAAIRILDALLLLATRMKFVAGLGLVRLHAPMLLRRGNRALDVLAALLWASFTLEMFSLREPVFNGIHLALGTHLRFGPAPAPGQPGPYAISVGQIVAVVAMIWGAVLLSRFVRFLMETDVYPRLRLGAGVPYAISSMLHYLVLIIAFFSATAVLEINMMQFTIVVSALGVGIGFGLQNIINNFVSGLILLFERPVKIGDSIQCGDAVGQVERIGIRASVLRTTDGAELIVPNGNLISNNVTNWTLSARARIITVPINIARGPDVAHVTALIQAAAAAHPKVLRDPAPQVRVLGIGAALSCELRAWTDDVSEWGRVRSDLLEAVSAALARENITLA